jgi:hypothetical protein
VDDAFFDYPEDNRQQAALQQFIDDVGEIRSHREQWTEYAAEHNLPEDPNAVPDKHGPWDMRLQYAMIVAFLPIGTLALGYFVRCHWMWIRADEQGLRTNAGKVAPWERLTDLDRSRWQSKGIAIVHFDNNGRPDRITLDDWKFETGPIRQIVQQVEQQLGLEHVPPTLQQAQGAQPQSSDAGTDSAEPVNGEEPVGDSNGHPDAHAQAGEGEQAHRSQ